MSSFIFLVFTYLIFLKFIWYILSQDYGCISVSMSSQIFYSFNEEYIFPLSLKNFSVTTCIDDFVLFNLLPLLYLMFCLLSFSICLDYTSFILKIPVIYKKGLNITTKFGENTNIFFTLRPNKQTIKSQDEFIYQHIKCKGYL